MPALFLALALSAPADSPPVVTEAELAQRESDWRLDNIFLRVWRSNRIEACDAAIVRLGGELAAGTGDAETLENQIGQVLERRRGHRLEIERLDAELVNGRPYFNLSWAGHAVAQGAKAPADDRGSVCHSP